MDIPTCPTCHRPGVQSRTSARTGRPYLANVETYPSGASYFRSLHTSEECASDLAAFEARIAEEIARTAAAERIRERMERGNLLTLRYKSIYGAEALATNWDAVHARWFA
jgi:hypothetical protein